MVTKPHRGKLVSVKSLTADKRGQKVAITTLTDAALSCVKDYSEKRAAMDLLECMRDIKFLFRFQVVLCENPGAIVYLSKLCSVLTDMSRKEELNQLSGVMPVALALFLNYNLDTPNHRLLSRIKDMSVHQAIYLCTTFKENVLNTIGTFIGQVSQQKSLSSDHDLTTFFLFLIDLSKKSKKTESIKEMMTSLKHMTEAEASELDILEHKWWIDLIEHIQSIQGEQEYKTTYNGDPLVTELIQRVKKMAFVTQGTPFRLSNVERSTSVQGGLIELDLASVYDSSVILLDMLVTKNLIKSGTVDYDFLISNDQVKLTLRGPKDANDKEGLFLKYRKAKSIDLPPPEGHTVTRSIKQDLYDECEAQLSYDGRRFSHRLEKDAELGSGKDRRLSRQKAYKHKDDDSGLMRFVVDNTQEKITKPLQANMH